jgi:hypothetical protein
MVNKTNMVPLVTSAAANTAGADPLATPMPVPKALDTVPPTGVPAKGDTYSTAPTGTPMPTPVTTASGAESRVMAASVKTVKSNTLDSTTPPTGNGELGESGELDSPNSPFPQRGDHGLVPPAHYYPEASIIGELVNHLHQQIETPKTFIVAGALTVLSMVVNRKVYFPWGDTRHFPNLFQACLGPSGVTRKTDLMTRIYSIVEELCPRSMLADCSSPERLVECFSEYSIRAMIHSEGKNLIDQINRSPGLSTLITRLYDCENISTDFKKDKRKTKDDEIESRIEARDTFLTILLGIPPDGWRPSEVNQKSGFMGRFPVLYATGPEHDILTPPASATKERRRLIRQLHQFGQLSGRMHFSKKASGYFRKIQEDNRRRMRLPTATEITNSSLSRMPFTIVRIAMLYEIAMSGKRQISADALRLAQAYVEFGHRCYVHFYEVMPSNKDLSRLHGRIVRTLEVNNERMPHSGLLNRVTRHRQWTEKEFKAALETLAARRTIRFEPNPNPNAHFPDIILVAQAEGSDGTSGAPAPTTAPTGTGKTTGMFDPAKRYVAQEK